MSIREKEIANLSKYDSDVLREALAIAERREEEIRNLPHHIPEDMKELLQLMVNSHHGTRRDRLFFMRQAMRHPRSNYYCQLVMDRSGRSDEQLTALRKEMRRMNAEIENTNDIRGCS